MLYRIATTRARERLTLSYPLDGRRGRSAAALVLPAARGRLDGIALSPGVKPLEKPAEPAEPVRPISDPKLLQAIFSRHKHFSPSGIDAYLQCPYLFFASKTLRLGGPPRVPYQRLDALWKGSVIHETISRWSDDPQAPIGDALEFVFDQPARGGRTGAEFP